jgi:hypothetical protein
MANVANDLVDREAACWAASTSAKGANAALWAIAGGLYRLAAATDRGARNLGPEAAAAAPIRGIETLAVAMDNVADAISEQRGQSIPNSGGRTDTR